MYMKKILSNNKLLMIQSLVYWEQHYVMFLYCAVPENIHTHPKEGQQKFQRG